MLSTTTVIGHGSNPPCSDHTVQEDHSMQEDSFTDPHTAQDTLPHDHGCNPPYGNTVQENEHTNQDNLTDHTNQDSIDPGVVPK